MYYEISTATFQKFFHINQKIFVIQEVPQKTKVSCYVGYIKMSKPSWQAVMEEIGS